jgi:hypothetical protein
MGYYAALNGSSVTTFRDNPSSSVKKSKKKDFMTLVNGTDRLSRNVGKEILFNAV